MRRSTLVPLLLLFAGALRADDVRLHNGKTFEGVIVAERDATLDLQLPRRDDFDSQVERA